MSGSERGGIIGLPQSWLGPVAELVRLYNRYGSLPRAITAIISSYIISSVFGFGSFIIGSVFAVFDALTLSLRWVQQRVGVQFGMAGYTVLDGVRTVQQTIGGAVESLGPAGPIVAIAFAAIVLALVYRVGVALIGELPVGSSVVDILGLR